MEKPHDYDRYRELAYKRMTGTITPEEAAELAQWLNEDDGVPLEVPASLAPGRAEQESRLLQAIEAQTRPQRAVPMRTHLLRMSAAAVVLLVLAAGSYFLLRPAKQEAVAVQRNHPVNDRLPAANQAILTLSNGKQVALNSMMNGPLGNTEVDRSIELQNGHLFYTQQEQGATVYMNRLSTPRGGQFRISLPDGSQVWLNAASSLTYPTAFRGRERVVELEGQAYFEVAKNAAMPFRVKAGKATVKVLGTHFDVMAYGDEATINATLVEGSVEVSDGGQAKLLQPLQQAVISRTAGAIVVQAANVDKVLAWKNDMFIFNNADFGTILREISRWYDVEIVNEAGSEKELFGGSISRKKNLSDVLKLLGAYGFHYKIEGKHVTILP